MTDRRICEKEGQARERKIERSEKRQTDRYNMIRKKKTNKKKQTDNKKDKFRKILPPPTKKKKNKSTAIKEVNMRV